ncbi:MAG: discoidin domain-containing protein, partial [Methanosarcinaceae archaeon]
MDWGITKWKTIDNPYIYNIENNINGIDGTYENIFNLDVMPAEILALHEEFTYKMVETIGDLDNVFWEVGNELHENSYTFQEHMITVIRAAESENGFEQKPIGITARMGDWGYAEGDALINAEMLSSNADWISPKDTVRVTGYHADGYAYDPPINDGAKVVISDTDHLRDINLPNNIKPELYQQWAWKSFLRGHNIMMMDDPEDINPTWEPHAIAAQSRHFIGDVRSYAVRLDLANMIPSETISNTKYCLSGNGEYITFQTHSVGTEIVLNVIPGTYNYEWFDTETSSVIEVGVVELSGTATFESPIDYGAVLYLKLVDSNQSIPEKIPHTDMTIVYVDSEELLKTWAPVQYILDDNPITQWHTEWILGTGHPHEVQICLGADYTVSGFEYLPRQDDGSGCYNGDVKAYEFYTSTDMDNWDLVAKGVFTKTKDSHTVYFSPTECKYVKFVALSEINGKRWTTCAELNVLGVLIYTEPPIIDDPVVPNGEYVTREEFNDRMDVIEGLLTEILNILKGN